MVLALLTGTALDEGAGLGSTGSTALGLVPLALLAGPILLHRGSLRITRPSGRRGLSSGRRRPPAAPSR